MLPTGGDRNCDVRNKCIRLFEKYEGDELQLKIAEATADEWLEMYRYAPFVSSKPKIALEYVAMTTIEKKNFDKEHPDWAESEEMKEYGNKENTAVQTMASNQAFLECAVHYLAADVPRREKIRGVLAGYPNAKVRMVQPTTHWED